MKVATLVAADESKATLLLPFTMIIFAFKQQDEKAYAFFL
jgi:hypothetical protein